MAFDVVLTFYYIGAKTMNARTELGSFNDEKQTLEQCIKDMRLQYENLQKNMKEANEEIAALKRQLEKFELIY